MRLVQYAIIRNDLKKYTTGMLIAQGIHACVQSIEKFREHSDTQEYLKNIGNMTTIVLQVNTEEYNQLKQILKEGNIDHIIWLEHPEEIETALALRPLDLDKNTVIRSLLKKYKLFK